MIAVILFVSALCGLWICKTTRNKWSLSIHLFHLNWGNNTLSVIKMKIWRYTGLVNFKSIHNDTISLQHLFKHYYAITFDLNNSWSCQ